jgi:hypothetical protein
MSIQQGFIKLKWNCGHTESVESAGWKECPTCLQGHITELERRASLAVTLYHANFPGFIVDALQGRDLSEIQVTEENTLLEFLDVLEAEEA